VMTREELVEAFTAERILKKSAVFDLEKLEWLNGRHLAETPADRLLERVRARLREEGAPGRLMDDDAWMTHLIDLLKVRARTVDDLAEQARPYVSERVTYAEDAVAKHWTKDPREAAQRLESLAERLGSTAWQAEPLEDALRALAAEMDVGAGKLIHPLRVALTGQMSSPGIFDVLVLLGRDRSLERIAEGKAFLDTASARTLG